MGAIKHFIFSFLFLVLLIIGCSPRQSAVEYGVSIAPMSGPDKYYETKMNESIHIDYEIAKDEKSVDLKLVVSKNPSHGKLINCDKSSELKLSCTYQPNSNFAGVDTIYVRPTDGDFTPSRDTIIKIAVIDPAAYPPVVGDDQSFILEENSEFILKVNMASDKDSSLNELEYQIVSGVSYGVLSNCFQGSGNLSCTYRPNKNFVGEDFFTYRVKDSTGNFSFASSKVSLKIYKKVYTAEENFLQAQNQVVSAVDITWIIDNSGSMENDQKRLKASFEAFTKNLIDTSANPIKVKYPFRMLVTTTDAFISGKTKARESSPGIIYDLSSTAAVKDYTKFTSDFKHAVGVGISGSSNEKSLLSGREIYKKYSTWYGGNDHLSVYIILSDEMEQSLAVGMNNSGEKYLDSEGNPYTIERWVYEYQLTKDNPSKVRVYPIILKSSDHGHVKGDLGGHYQKIANLSGGKLYDISQSFDEVLNDLGLDVSHLFNAYLLNGNRVIDASTVKVYVDGIQIFYWNYRNNAIKFTTPPPAGSKIKVTYRYTEK